MKTRFLSGDVAGLTASWVALEVEFGGRDAIDNGALRCCGYATNLIWNGPVNLRSWRLSPLPGRSAELESFRLEADTKTSTGTVVRPALLQRRFSKSLRSTAPNP